MDKSTTSLGIAGVHNAAAVEWAIGRRLSKTKGWTDMGMMQEFKEFAMKGNVLDLAVGVIMGAAFSPIVSTLVDNIVMPPIGYLMAGVDFSTLSVAIPTPTDPVMIKYGLFLNAIIKFLITAFAIFLLVKGVNSMKKPAAEAAAAAPPAQEVLLKEIRDLLAKR